MIRYYQVIFLFVFQCFTYSLYANLQADSLVEQIKNNSSFGKLTKAEALTDNLLELYPEKTSYYHYMAVILKSEIIGKKGDMETMEILLKSIQTTLSDPELISHWEVAFSQYCFLNQRYFLASRMKENSIKLGQTSPDIRLKINGLFDELFMIYYTQNIEQAIFNKEPLPERVGVVFKELDSYYANMQLHEKQKLLEYKLYFVDVFNPEEFTDAVNKILAFGSEYESPNATLLGYLQQALYNKIELNDTILELESLKKAYAQSTETEDLKFITFCNYEMTSHYFRTGNHKKAIEYGKKAIFPENVDFSNYFDSYGLLSKIYEECGMIDSALYYKKIDYEKYKTISTKYNENMQTFFIENLQENLELKESRIQKSYWNILILSVLLFAISALVFYMLRLNRVLKLKNKELNMSNSALENFSNILSHDLRAPIHSIKNLSSYILDEEQNLSEDSKDSLRLIERTSNRSTLLISNIMTYVRFKEEPEIEEELELKSVIGNAIDNLNSIIKQESVNFNFLNLPEKIKGNEALLILLFQNLFQNAIKAKDKDHLSISIDARKTKIYNIIRVRDNGCGIRKEKLNVYTRAFEQETFESVEKGIGLGLSICSNIMQYHQGKLEIESEFSKGTTMILCFPKNNLSLS